MPEAPVPRDTRHVDAATYFEMGSREILFGREKKTFLRISFSNHAQAIANHWI